jgi:hypothetical protein
VIVDVGLLAVLLLLVSLTVIVAVRQLGVVVLVRVPVRSMLPFPQWSIRVMVRDVIVIVGVCLRRMRMLRLLALALGTLLDPLLDHGAHLLLSDVRGRYIESISSEQHNDRNIDSWRQ